MARQSIGEFLSTLRRAHGFTQQEVADKLGISNRTLSAWERDTSAPDILLLPVLADLYGVTVDEILRGERNSGEEKPLSKNSHTRIYKSRLATFTLQSWVITGVLILGLTLFFAGWFTDIRTVAWVGWQWWLLLFWLGLSVLVLGGVSLIALWRYNETAAEDEEGEGREQSGTFCILLRRRVTTTAYFVAAPSLIFGLTALFLTWGSDAFLALVIFFLAFAAACYFAGLALSRYTLERWAEEGKAVIGKNKKLAVKIAAFGLIPFLIANVLVGSMSAFNFTVCSREIVRKETKEDFTRYMETLVVEPYYGAETPEADEYCLALSELAKTAHSNEKIEFAKGVYVEFTEEMRLCTVTVVYHAEGNDYLATFYYYAYLIEITEDYSVYNLRTSQFRYEEEYDDPLPPLADYTGFSERYVADENGYAYVVDVTANYTSLGAVIAFFIVMLDVLVCCIFYYHKREKLRIKL